MGGVHAGWFRIHKAHKVDAHLCAWLLTDKHTRFTRAFLFQRCRPDRAGLNRLDKDDLCL